MSARHFSLSAIDFHLRASLYANSVDAVSSSTRQRNSAFSSRRRSNSANSSTTSSARCNDGRASGTTPARINLPRTSLTIITTTITRRLNETPTTPTHEQHNRKAENNIHETHHTPPFRTSIRIMFNVRHTYIWKRNTPNVINNKTPTPNTLTKTSQNSCASEPHHDPNECL